MPTQKILLGDCLDVFANERNIEAFVSDPPANIEFMGRSWDGSEPALDYVPMIPARDKAHLREMQIEHSFSRYWAKRYAMAYDIADQHAINIVWTLPRTSHQTANALRAAGWRIKDNVVHLFGTGWAKSGNALAPGQEGWLLAVKGKPDLDTDACRVPRGGEPRAGHNGTATSHARGEFAQPYQPGDAAKHTRTGGSLPKNALLSHCEKCVRVGSKSVKGTPARDKRGEFHGAYKLDPRASVRDDVHHGFGDNGTESVPAWHCLAGCVCGARSKWDPEKPLPRCPCGETWRWLCAVAEVNEQSGNRPGMSGGGKHRDGYSGGLFGAIDCDATTYADQGGGARFFNTFSYLSKCSSSERHAGCENLFWRANKKNPFGFDQVTREEWEALPTYGGNGKDMRESPAHRRHDSKDIGTRAQGNVHPTVKSYRLMHWLHSLTGAKRILDFTAGSGTGMLTAAIDGIEWLGAEICPEAITIAQARHAFWTGLSHEARRAMVEESVVPSRFEPDERQRSLF